MANRDLRLTEDEKVALIVQHAQKERAKDWDSVLSTMVEPAVYEYYPYRLRITGAEAVKEMWLRIFALRCLDYSIGRHVLSLERCVNEDAVVNLVENEFPDEEGNSVRSTIASIFRFDGPKIVSESVHFDNNMLPYLDEVFLDPKFLALAGVEHF